MARAIAGGCAVNAPLPDAQIAATYIADPLGDSLEMLCLPPSLHASYGWVARPPAYR